MRLLALTTLALALALPAVRAADVAELERRAATAPAGEKTVALVEFSRALEYVDMARAMSAAEEAGKTALTPRDKLLAEAQRAAVLRRRGDYGDAMALARTGLGNPTTVDDPDLRLEYLFVVAQTFWSLADYPAAIETFQEVIKLGEERKNLLMVARAENGIGIVLYESGQTDKAREQFEKSLALAERINAPDLRAWVLNNYGVLHNTRGDNTRARVLLEESLRLRRELKDVRGEADSLVNLGMVALKAGDPRGAVDFTQRALAIYEQLGLKRHVVNARRDTAAALRALGRHDDSLAQLNAALSVAEGLGVPSVLANVYREFAATHEARGDFRQALEFTRKLATASDAAHDQSSRRRVDELQARFAAEKRQHEIALLRGDQARQTAELERARWQQYALAGALVLGVVILGAIISRQRLKARADRRVLEEARAARAAAEEADRVKTRFLGIASHDIRTPLGNIIHLATAIRDGDSLPHERTEHCDFIGSEAQRVLTLVDDLITTAALEAGRLEVRFASIDLAALTRDVILSVSWQAKAKRQQIVFPDPSAGSGVMQGDAARLQQVVANLLTNAIKFSPTGETITLTLAREAEQVILSVRDRGAGLAADDIEKLFAPFSRLASQPTAGESSHGLGLSIAQEIARRHGGTIRVESRPGDGANFIVELPIDPGAAVAKS